MSSRPPYLEQLAATGPAGRAAIVRARLVEARDAVGRALAAGEPGDVVCHALCDELDRLVLGLWHAAAPARGASGAAAGRIALVATGGWGRRETCPHSDLDLLVLVPEAPGEEVGALAERVLYPLWDAGLEVGHAVRSIGGAVELAAGDLPTATALLDARTIAGDRELGDTLARGLLRALCPGGDPNPFVARLADEKAARHARFGDSLYLLEPNLKHGQGGLRDLATGLWAARARWRVRDFPDLLPGGRASARQVAALVAAREHLLRIRSAIHLAARRRQDQLSFELQEAIAPRFHPAVAAPSGQVRPAVAPAVEELMRLTYLHTRAALRETDRLLARARVATGGPPAVEPIDATFALVDGEVAVADPVGFRARPSEAVRLFRTALALDRPVHADTQVLVAEHVASDGPRIGADPEARGLLLEVLVDPSDRRQPSVLEQMHELGLLQALIPELGPTVGRVQHDLYHVYTVDVHQLYAVAMLKRVARGELAAEVPAITASMRAVARPAPLYLATLLHDVGKPLGRGHAEQGARLAAGIARRMRLEPDDVRRTEFLVRHHLLMSHLSQRRDLDDLGVIAGFARVVGDEETLRELTLLTYADTAMTAPGNMTEWKARLLVRLAEGTGAYLRRGPDLAGADRSARVRRRRRRVAELLGAEVPAAELDDWLAGLPDRYLGAFSPKTIVRHLRLSRARGDRAVGLTVTHHPLPGWSEVAVVADDAPGRLAQFAGVMLANRIDVVGARIASRDRGRDRPREAIDVFQVRDRYGRPIPVGDPRWLRVEEDLARVLSGAQTVEALVAARGGDRAALPARVTPAVATEIAVDNASSPEFTIIDVVTGDRLGVLYAITRTLAALGLDIGLSRVATEADRVTDVFYVRDRAHGGKVADDDGARLALALRTALAAVQEAGSARPRG